MNLNNLLLVVAVYVLLWVAFRLLIGWHERRRRRRNERETRETLRQWRDNQRNN